MKFIAAALPLGLAAVASAAPTTRSISPGRVINVVEALIAAAPGSETCTDAPVAAECSTAEEVAPKFVEALLTYGIYDINEISAIVAVMSLESESFKYNRNHFAGKEAEQYPNGRPGQGTSNMQIAKFNLEYIKTIPDLGDDYADLTEDKMTDEQKNAMVKKLNDNNHSFATGAWFYATHCKEETKALLRSDPDAGYVEYVAKCISAGDAGSPGRTERWNLAKAAFGVA